MTIFQKGFLILVLVFLAVSGSACGTRNQAEPTQVPDAQTGSLAVRDPWSRPAISGDNGAAFFMIDNARDSPVALVSASSDIAAMVEIHLSSMVDGVMKMEPQDKVEVPAQSQLEFKTGSYHIMLINLIRDLKVGDTYKLDLKFDTGETLPIIVTVKEP